MVLPNNIQSNGGRVSWQDQLQGMPHLISSVDGQDTANADPKTTVGVPNCNLQCSTLFPIVEVLQTFLPSSLPRPVRGTATGCFCIDRCPLCVSASLWSYPSPTFKLGAVTAGRTNRCFLMSGGRTAWSSTVTVQGQNVAARYWYDGQYINNAKEDAAEVALMRLSQQTRAPSTYSGQLFPQQNGIGRGMGF